MGLRWKSILMFGGPIALASIYLIYKVSVKKIRKAHRGLHDLNIKVVENEFQWNEAEKTILTDLRRNMVLGFDCEWSNDSAVAILQLATSDPNCVILRLPKFCRAFPETLLQILGDRKILKVGVGPHVDVRRLANDHGIIVRGYLDLGWLAMAFSRDEVEQYGLQALARQFLQIHISKSKSLRCSDWDSEVLSQSQILYAATDAFISVKIFMVLVTSQLSIWDRIQPLKPKPWVEILPVIGQWVHCIFKPTVKPKNVASRKSSNFTQQKPLKKPHSFTTRKSPLYHNCILQSPDGQPLCTCATKKVLWYLEHELADVVSDQPVLIVKLRFEPSGRPLTHEDYYLQPKENCCVVCGFSESYIRKNIIPQEYRKHFPAIMKNHKSHDVVLLCPTCHQTSNLHDLTCKEYLAIKYSAPLEAQTNSKLLENPDLRKVKSAARALNQPKIPTKRRHELETIICDYYGVSQVDEEIREKAANMETRSENTDYISHGYKVVQEAMKTESGILDLEVLWRLHFVNTMKPRFMPKLWSIEHKHPYPRMDASH